MRIKQILCLGVLSAVCFLPSSLLADACPPADSLIKNSIAITGVDSAGRVLKNSRNLQLDQSVVFSRASIFIDPRNEINGDLTCTYYNSQTGSSFNVNMGDHKMWDGENWRGHLPVMACSSGSNNPADCPYHSF